MPDVLNVFKVLLAPQDLERLARRQRRKPKWCHTCGGRHAGGASNCVLVQTTHGTWSRPSIKEMAERRHRERRRR